MLPRLPVYILLFLPLAPVQRSTADSSEKSSASSPHLPPPPLGDPSWALGLRLYQALRSDSRSVNTLFSPLLAASSLGALGGGSAGASASQFQDLLKASSSAKAGAELLSESLKSLGKSNGTSFHAHASTALFSKEAPQVSQAFVKDSQARFGLQHQPLGKGDSKADLKRLRSWAKVALGGLDPAPLAAEIQAKAGSLILANAFSFKGLWEREFGEGSSDLRTFLGKKYTKIMMMHRAGLYRFHEDIQNMVQVLEAPLWGGKASMVLLLPFHVEDLARLDKLLTVQLVSKWLEKSSMSSISISLPKANISSALSLQKPLSALGLVDAWDQKVADFSGVSGKAKGKLHLSTVLQWTSLELAAQAGPGEDQLEEEEIEKPKMFYADHPFVFLVRDNATGALLLMGALDHVEGEAVHDEL
ncbi:serine (or cysteine) peptidase inhibitor, clade H, member 2 isoform X2 [Takifugu rubripes]|nr:serpin H1-like isoform X2 [Takifugu rubripes]